MPINFQIPMRNAIYDSQDNFSGICMSISSFWIQRCHQMQQPPNAGDPIFTNWQNYETMGIAFETLLNDYNNITGGDGNINSQDALQRHALVWHDQFTRQLNLPSRDINWGTLDTFDYLISIMEQGPTRGYLITGYRTQNIAHGGLQLNGGHTMAFWYGNNNKTFMDPNFGQYTCPRANNWTALLRGHMTHYYNGFNQWVIIQIG